MKEIQVDRLLVSIFALTLLHHLWAMTVGWDHTLLPIHGFRQSQTAISAYSILQGGPWLAYHTPVLGAPWAIPFEFPLYQWIVVLGVKFLSLPMDIVGRGVSIILFYGSLVWVYLLLRRLNIRRTYCLVPLSFILGSPLYIYWTRAFLIESTAIFLSLASLWGWVRLVDSPSVSRWKHGGEIVLFAMVVGLASTVKITTFFVFGVVAVLWFLHQYWGVPPNTRINWLKQRWVSLGIFALSAGGCLIGWTRFSDAHKALNPLAYFITSSALSDWNFGTWELRFSGRFWNVIFSRILIDIFGNTYFIWTVVAGASFFKKRVILGWTFLFLGFLSILTFSNLHYIHEYYQYSMGLFWHLALGFFLIGVLETKHKWGVRLAFFGVICSLGFSIHRYWTGWLVYQRYNEQGILNTAQLLKKYTKPKDILFILGCDWDSTLPYYSERRAVMDRLNLPKEDSGIQSSLKLLESETIGSLVACYNIRSQADYVAIRALELGMSPDPVFRDPYCDIYLSPDNLKRSTRR